MLRCEGDGSSSCAALVERSPGFAHIVDAGIRAYVMEHNRGGQDIGMSDTVTFSDRRNWRPLLVVGVVAALLLAGTVGLWVHYGTAVFYEMILAGIAMCL